ncbi:uncharacterized protein RCO7_03908 [Rhynchosporium graminicola]|uniref:Uncharacterized protein n=1 Tax=Rhynchosporium graminicola TaxID=2792576 RepID=A0A1E1L5B8_9HELO|nr:uncharacterized protein RCO7_03908 [Rhynchosporium commune]
MADILELLSSLGVLETEPPPSVANSIQDNKTTTTTFSLVSHAGPSSSDLVGAVPGTDIQEPNRAGDPIPKYQPSLFWKALAFAFADSSYLSTATSLSDEGQALFLANSDQPGVPAGRPYPDEVTNYQTFAKGDAIQIINHPTYSLEGDSYFEYLSLYMRSVVNDSDDPNLTQSRAALIKAKLDKDKAYEHARIQYESKFLKGSQNATRPAFIDALTHDDSLQSALKNELACENKYTTLQGDNMADVSNKLDTIKNADNRLMEKVGNNMPCIAVSDDYIRDPTIRPSGKIVVDPKDVYYRPLYNLPNFDATCNNWQAINSDVSKIERVGPLPILMAEAASRSWSELGHDGLDSAIPAPLSDAQKELLQTLQISLTFLGKPAAVSLDRGMWDVPNVRSKFKVASTLPAVVRRPFCKTTKMLLAWGMEICITFAISVTDLSKEKISLAGFKIPPLDADADNPNQMRFVAGRSTYPLLLAVLAKIV